MTEQARDRRLPRHGTRARYARGCSCDPCKDGNAAYQRGYDAGKRGAPSSERHREYLKGWDAGRRHFDATPLAAVEVVLDKEGNRVGEQHPLWDLEP